MYFLKNSLYTKHYLLFLSKSSSTLLSKIYKLFQLVTPASVTATADDRATNVDTAIVATANAWVVDENNSRLGKTMSILSRI